MRTITWRVACDDSIVPSSADSGVEANKVAFLRLLNSSSVGVRDVGVEIIYDRAIQLPAPARGYDFTSGYDALARQHFVRMGLGSGDPLILITARQIAIPPTPEGAEGIPNAVALELLNAILVTTGPGGAQAPGVGLHRNDNILAHELGHLAGYRSNEADPKHAAKKRHVMHHAVQPGRVVGDAEYAQRISAYAGATLTNLPI